MNTDLQSPTIGKIASALVKAQASMGVAIKDTRGQIGQNRNYKYADLASVIAAARDALATNDLAVLQRAHPSERGVCLQTTLVHASGEWISDGGLVLPAPKNDPQGFGSAMTYARRYGLAALLGIVQDDDDGAAAVAAQQRAREQASQAALLTPVQASILSMIAQRIRPGHTPDLAGKLAEDYPKHLRAVIQFAVKGSYIEEADAVDLEAAGLALDGPRVEQLLAQAVVA